MLAPEKHPNENLRIKALQSLSSLNSAPEERFDRLTRIVSNLFDVPIALISIVDVNKQWFKSCIGMEGSETPRDVSFCGHAILGDDVFVIRDTLKDVRFADNPSVTEPPYIRFYAGCPLIHPDGYPLGTLCLIDRKPRDFTDEEAVTLKEIATLAELELVHQQSATMDEESQLSNKEGFLFLGKQSMAVCKRLNLSVSLAFLFVKGLAIHGYESDFYKKTIKEISAQFSDYFQSSDVVARYDKNSFVALMTNTDEASANERLQRLVSTLNMQFEAQSIELATGAVSGSPDDDLGQIIFSAFAKLNEGF